MLYTALEIIHSLGYIINEDISIKENPKSIKPNLIKSAIEDAYRKLSAMSPTINSSLALRHIK